MHIQKQEEFVANMIIILVLDQSRFVLHLCLFTLGFPSSVFKAWDPVGEFLANLVSVSFQVLEDMVLLRPFSARRPWCYSGASRATSCGA